MTKLYKAVLSGVILSSGLATFSTHHADAATYKKVNYYDKNVVKKIKEGKFNTIAGIKIGDDVRKLNNKKNYVVNTIDEDTYTGVYYYGGSYEINSVYGIIDFPSEGKTKISRLRDYPTSDKFIRTKMLKLYGKPAKGNTQYYYLDDSKVVNSVVDYYKNAAFFYTYDINDRRLELTDVVVYGDYIKKNLKKYKKYIKVNNHGQSYEVDDYIHRAHWDDL